MELIQYYGELKKVVKGEGYLFTKSGKKLSVEFEVAKRVDGTLLFGANTTENDIGLFFDISNSGVSSFEGLSESDIKVKCSKLFLKNIDASIINGYVGKCEIGEKIIGTSSQLKFSINNFLFIGNKSKELEKEDGKKHSISYLDLNFQNFECQLEQVDDYQIVRKLLKRQGGIIQTSTLNVEDIKSEKFDGVIKNVNKLCQLFSVARSTNVDWSHYKLLSNGEIVYELYGNKIKRDYHGNALIDVHHKQTVKFLESAWVAYDKYESLFDMRRLLYGYIDTFEETFIESRSLLKSGFSRFYIFKISRQRKEKLLYAIG